MLSHPLALSRRLPISVMHESVTPLPLAGYPPMARPAGSGEDLLVPVVGEAAVVEGNHFLVSVASVKTPRLGEVAARIQTEPGHGIGAGGLFGGVRQPLAHAETASGEHHASCGRAGLGLAHLHVHQATVYDPIIGPGLCAVSWGLSKHDQLPPPASP